MFRLSTIVIIALLSFTAFAAIAPGPERAVSTIVYEPPSGEQRPGAVATDGSDYVSLWTDVSVPRAGIYATRIPAHGSISVASERLVRAGAAREVALCYGSGGYLAAWTDVETNSVFTAKLNTDGSVIAGPRAIINGETENDLVTNPASVLPRGLACSSSGALLVFHKATPMITLLDANGLPTGTAKKLAIGDDDPVVAVSDGTKYFIASRSVDSQNVSITRVSSTGALTDATPQTIFTGFLATQIGMAYAGNRLGLAAVSANTLKRAFVDPATLTATKLPDVAQGGQEVGVVGIGNALDAFVMNYNLSKLDALRVPLRDNETTAPTPSNALHSDALGSSVSVASNGSDVLAVWKDFRRSAASSAVDGDVYAATLDTGAGGGTPFPVVVTARWQNPVAIASSGTESLVVWNERVGDAGKTALMGVRFDPTGVLLGAPVQLAASVVSTSAPSITWDGTSYIVAWNESVQTNFGLMTSVVVQRYKKDGTTLGSQIRFDGPFTEGLASNGSSALLAFTYPDGRGMNVVMLSDPATIKPLNTYGYGISVGTAGGDYLVTYTEGAETCNIICFPDKRDISGIRVSGSGTILDATPIPIANGLKDQAFQHVASNGSEYLISYNFKNEDNTWSVAAKRVSRNGQLLDALANQDGVVIANDVATSNAIVRDDDTYVVAYDAGTGVDSTVLRLARTDDKGNVTERSGSLGAATRAIPASPALVKVPGGPVDIAYSRYATEAAYGGTMRAFVRLTPDATPQPGKQRGVRH